MGRDRRGVRRRGKVGRAIDSDEEGQAELVAGGDEFGEGGGLGDVDAEGEEGVVDVVFEDGLDAGDVGGGGGADERLGGGGGAGGEEGLATVRGAAAGEDGVFGALQERFGLHR